MNLKHKRILISGAARGLGRELAALLEQEGAALVLVDRETPPFPHAEFHACDLGDASQRKKLIEAVGRIDILINCAGVGSHSRLDQLTAEEVGRVMQVNALAPLELSAGLAPLELVVNIGSVAGEMNLPSMSLYAASKAAVHAFTRCAQLEGAPALLVILGPLRGTDFAQSIAHPRRGQPNWYRSLDLPVETAARLIVQAIKRGQGQLIAPRWYGLLFPLARILSPLIRALGRRYAAL